MTLGWDFQMKFKHFLNRPAHNINNDLLSVQLLINRKFAMSNENKQNHNARERFRD